MNRLIGFSEEEIKLIKQRYPIVDLENPDLPPVGLSTISSLDYLDSAVRFDIANSPESSELAEILLSIARKIETARQENRY